MEKTLDIPEAGRRLEQLVDDVAGNGRRAVYLLARDGHPIAAVVPIDVYEQWKQRRREAFVDRMEEISQRANLSAEEAEQLADEAVRWARGQL